MMFIFTAADDNIYGGVGVRPAVLHQCDNYHSHQPKWFYTGNTDGINDMFRQE